MKGKILLRQVNQELRYMMENKGHDTPSESWHDRYYFLVRYRQHVKSFTDNDILKLQREEMVALEAKRKAHLEEQREIDARNKRYGRR